MVHIQKWDNKETSLVREVEGNTLTLVSSQADCICSYSMRVSLPKSPYVSLPQTLSIGKVICKRIYEKAE